jgi:hypothetical protein
VEWPCRRRSSGRRTRRPRVAAPLVVFAVEEQVTSDFSASGSWSMTISVAGMSSGRSPSPISRSRSSARRRACRVLRPGPTARRRAGAPGQRAPAPLQQHDTAIEQARPDASCVKRELVKVIGLGEPQELHRPAAVRAVADGATQHRSSVSYRQASMSVIGFYIDERRFTRRACWAATHQHAGSRRRSHPVATGGGSGPRAGRSRSRCSLSSCCAAMAARSASASC